MNKLNLIQNCVTVAINTIANHVMFYTRYLEKKHFPVYIRSTGDKVWLSKDYGVNEAQEYKLEQVPRCVMSITNVEFPESKRSLGRQDSFYKLEVAEMASKKARSMKVVGYEIEIKVQFVLPDFLHLISFVEFLQEAFIDPNIPISFQADGMTNNAVMYIDTTSPDMDLNIVDGFEQTDLYPTLETTIKIIGNKANFGMYKLSNGGHGYDGYNPDAVTDFVESNDLDADKVITKVTVNTTIEENDGTIGTDSYNVT